MLACSLPFLCLCCSLPPVHPHPPLGPWSSKGLNGEPPGAQSVALPAIGLSHLVLHKAFAQAAASRQLPQEKRGEAFPPPRKKRSLQLPLGASRFLFSVPLLALLPPSGAPSPPSPSFKPQMEGPAPREGEALALITCADGALSARGCDAMCLASSGPDAPPCSSMAAIPLHSLEVEASSPIFSHFPLDSFIYSFICLTNMNPGMSTFTTRSTGNTVMSK